MYTVTEPAAMNETFARAVNSRELANVLALYEKEAVLLVDGSGREARGKADLASELSNLLAMPGTMRSKNNFCVEHGDLALLRADWMVLGADGAVIATGSTAEIVRRQADGRWLYVVDHAAGAGLDRVL